MMISPEILALVRRRIEDAERNLHIVKKLLSGEEGAGASGATAVLAPPSGEARVTYGRFDGEHMEGEDGQLYPVPANYASKSKLVEGDKLKLTIEPDGAFVYKQIAPIERRRVLGTFVLDEHGNYVVQAEEKAYRVLLASVTFYRLEPGDQVTILLPSEGLSTWGAVEHAMKPSQTVPRNSSDEGETALPTPVY